MYLIMPISKILRNLCAMCNKTKCKTKCKIKTNFCRFCFQCFSSERVLAEHKETCLKINGKQTVKLRRGLIKFKNLFKQLGELGLVIGMIILYTLKNIKHIFLAVSLINLFVLMINLVFQLFFTAEKMGFVDSMKHFWKSMIIAKKVMKKYFDKNLVMSEKKKMNRYFIQVRNAGYVTNYVIQETIE